MSNEFNTGSYQEEMGEELAEQQKINPAYQNESSYTEWELYTFDNINNSNKDAVIKLNTKTFIKISKIGYIKLLDDRQATAINTQEDVITNTSISIYKTFNKSYIFNPLFNKDINIFDNNIYIICKKTDAPIRDIGMFTLLSKIEYLYEDNIFSIRESIPLKDWFRIFKNCDADVLVDWQQGMEQTTISKIELLNKNQRVLLSEFLVKGKIFAYGNVLHSNQYTNIPLEFESDDNVFPLWIKPINTTNTLRFYFPWFDFKNFISPFKFIPFVDKPESIYFKLCSNNSDILIPDNYYKIFLYNLATISANNLNFMSNGGLSPEFLSTKQIRNINDYLYAMRANTDAINVFSDFYLDASKTGGFWDINNKIPVLDVNSEYYYSLMYLFKMCSYYCYSKLVYGGGLSESGVVLQPFYFDNFLNPVDYYNTFKTAIDKNGNLNVVDINLPSSDSGNPLSNLDYKVKLNSSYFNFNVVDNDLVIKLKNKVIKNNKIIKGNDKVYNWNELPVLVQNINLIDDSKQSLETNELNYLVFLGLGDINNGVNDIWKYLLSDTAKNINVDCFLDLSETKQDISDENHFKEISLQILKLKGFDTTNIDITQISKITETIYPFYKYNFSSIKESLSKVNDITIATRAERQGEAPRPGVRFGIPWGSTIPAGANKPFPVGNYSNSIPTDEYFAWYLANWDENYQIFDYIKSNLYTYEWVITFQQKGTGKVIPTFDKVMDLLELDTFINAALNPGSSETNKFSFVLQEEFKNLGIAITDINEINIIALGYSLNNEIRITYLKNDGSNVVKSLFFNLNDKDNLKNTMTNIQII
ncbi:MAG: hypothetical protein ACRCW6_03405 [Mycoplasmoidaceae bacterium]